MSMAEDSEAVANPGGSEAERWVWNEVRAGRPADLNAHCGAHLDAHDMTDGRWHDARRQISAAFIKRVLTEERWHQALPDHGLLVVGARVAEGLDLIGARVNAILAMECSRFESEVNLNLAQFNSGIDFRGSTFEKGINAPYVRIGGSMMLQECVVRAPLWLRLAEIGLDLLAFGSIFEAAIEAERLHVSGTFNMSKVTLASGSMLKIRESKIDGDLIANTAVFDGGIDAERLRLGGILYLNDGAVVRGGPLVLRGAVVGGSLAMDGSVFEGGIDAVSLRVNSGLFLRNGAVIRGGPLVLRAAVIEENLEMGGCTCEEGIDAERIRVESLRLEGGVVRGKPLVLRMATIKNNLQVDNAIFEAGISAERLHVGGGFYMRKAEVCGGSLSLWSTVVKDALAMEFAAIRVVVNAERLHVGSHFFLQGATFEVTPVIRFARIDGSFALNGATLPGLDLSGTVVAGEIMLSSAQGVPPTWREDARLILRNVRTGALQDRRDAWPLGPESLDLQGFAYERLGGIFGSGEDAMLTRPVKWYVDWLDRDPSPARQPYQQLASVLRVAGYPDRADTVLYAARERERVATWRQRRYLTATGLELLRWTIGYGLTPRFPRRVLACTAVLTALGALVLSLPPSKAGDIHSLMWRVFASLDQLLPILRLDSEFGNFFNDPTRQNLAFWQHGYFVLHKLLGFLLGSFVVAAVAGLTQARR